MTGTFEVEGGISTSIAMYVFEEEENGCDCDGETKADACSARRKAVTAAIEIFIVIFFK
jgi:hypothetical protein